MDDLDAALRELDALGDKESGGEWQPQPPARPASAPESDLDRTLRDLDAMGDQPPPAPRLPPAHPVVQEAIDGVRRERVQEVESATSKGVFQSFGTAITDWLDRIDPGYREQFRQRREAEAASRDIERYVPGSEKEKVAVQGISGVFKALGGGLGRMSETASRFDPSSLVTTEGMIENLARLAVGTFGLRIDLPDRLPADPDSLWSKAARYAADYGREVEGMNEKRLKDPLWQTDKETIDELKKWRKERWFVDTVDYAVNSSIKMAANVAPIIGVGVATGGTAVVPMLYTMSVGELDDAMKEAGVDPREHETLLYSAAALHASLEYIPGYREIMRALGREARKEIMEATFRDIARGFAKGSAREGITEGLQTSIEVAVPIYALSGSIGQATGQVWQDVLKGTDSKIIEAFAQAAIGGGVLAGASSTLSRGAVEGKANDYDSDTAATDRKATEGSDGRPSDPALVGELGQGQAAAPAEPAEVREIREFVRSADPEPTAAATPRSPEDEARLRTILADLGLDEGQAQEVVDGVAAGTTPEQAVEGIAARAYTDAGLLTPEEQDAVLAAAPQAARTGGTAEGGIDAAGPAAQQPGAGGADQRAARQPASPGPAGEATGAAAGPVPIRPDIGGLERQQARFRSLIADGSIPVRDLGRRMGLAEADMAPLLVWAKEQGLLRVAPNGETRRTAKARQEQTAAIPRIDRRIEAVEQEAGQPLVQAAKDYAAMLEDAGADRAAARRVIDEIRADRTLRKAEVDDVARAYTGEARTYRTRADAIARIDAVQKERARSARRTRIEDARWRAGQSLRREPNPVSLVDFLRARGGVREDGGDLGAMDAAKQRPGLVNRNGLDLDEAREMAVEAGYLADTTDEVVAESTGNDLLDAIRNDLAGERVYSAVNSERVAAMREDEETAAAREVRAGREKELQGWFEANGLPFTMTDFEVDLAAEALANGADIDTAVETAFLASVEGDHAVDGGPASEAVRGAEEQSLVDTFDRGADETGDPGPDRGGSGEAGGGAKAALGPAVGEALAALAAGREVVVDPTVVEFVNSNLRRDRHIVPAEANVGTVARIRPIHSYGDGKLAVEVVVRTIDRGDVSFPLFAADLLSSGALRVPGAIEAGRVTSDGRSLVLSVTLDSTSDDARSLGGKLWHEAVHELYEQGRYGATGWDRLVAHAKGLRILDLSMQEWHRQIGAPNWHLAADHSLREVYHELYRGDSRRIDEEEVAHFMQGYAVGILSPDEIAPVRDILEAMRAGVISGNAAARQVDDAWVQRLAEAIEMPPPAPLFMFAGPPTANEDASTGQSMRRDLDQLGYYSKALEAARGLKQAKGTPEQMLAQLKKAGVKDAEIEATGLRSILDGKKSITRDEIVSHLEGKRVGLKEVVRAGSAERGVRAADLERRAREAEERGDTATANRLWNESEALFMDAGDANEPKWAAYSLDPSNPTYRETVLHLPEQPARTPRQEVILARRREILDAEEAIGRLYQRHDNDERSVLADPEYAPLARIMENAEVDGLSADSRRLDGDAGVFRSGHFPEPNIVGHMMTSMTTHEGRPVFTLDQIQSDWGQKLRDGGVRDEAKIAELKRQSAAADETVRTLLAKADELLSDRRNRATMNDLLSVQWKEMLTRLTLDLQRGSLAATDRTGFSRLLRGTDDRGAWDTQERLSAAVPEAHRIRAELDAAESSAAGNPLVNTTDQWVNTTLRRAIRQATEAGAEFIAIPHGDTVRSYNPGDENGMRGFYGSATSEGIVPKNLRKLLAALDKSAPAPEKIDTLDSPSGKTGLGRGFTLFRLTDAAKRAVMEEGQPLFAFASPLDQATAAGFEVPLRAAIRTEGGQVFTGNSHSSAIAGAEQALGRKVTQGGDYEGFETSSGRFVTRAEAGDLLKNVGLYSGGELHSFDLRQIRAGNISEHQRAQLAAFSEVRNQSGQEDARQQVVQGAALKDVPATSRGLEAELLLTFGFAKAKVRDSKKSIAAAQDVVKALRIVAEVTQLPTVVVGGGGRAQIHVSDRFVTEMLDGFHIGFVKWLPAWMRAGRATLFVNSRANEGAGETAVHEWAHFLDHVAGQQAPLHTGAPRIGATRRYNPLVLLDRIITGGLGNGPFQWAWNLGLVNRWPAVRRFWWMRPEMAAAWKELTDAIRHGEMSAIQRFMAERQSRKDRKDQYYSRQDIREMEAAKPPIERARQEGKRYYATPHEMFARAFQVYVGEKALKSGYSKGVVEDLFPDSHAPIRRGERSGGIHLPREYMNPKDPSYDRMIAAFDKIFAEMRVGSDNRMLFRVGPAASFGSIRPGLDERRAQMAVEVESELARMLPRDVAIRIVDTFSRQYANIRGVYEPTVKLLAASMRHGGADGVRATGWHEVVHALREAGAYTDTEWQTLLARARKVGADEKIEQSIGLAGYAEFYADTARRAGISDIRAFVRERLYQEQVAHMAEEWANGTSFGKTIDALLARLVEIMRAIKTVLERHGFTHLADVVEQAEVAGIRGRMREGIIRDRIQTGTDPGLLDRRASFMRLMMPESEAVAEAWGVATGGPLYSFGGENAETADLAALDQAKEMDAGGDARETIWRETGWFKGVDGRWRFEIDDSGATYIGGEGHAGRLGRAMLHRNLYEAYPDLEGAGTIAMRGERVRGSYQPDSQWGFERIDAIGPTDDIVLSALLHEAGHAVQTREGFARGGARSMFSPLHIEAERARLEEEEKRMPKADGWASVGTSIPVADMTDEEIAFRLYQRISGEVEARTIQARIDLTEDQRKARPPWLDYDVPEGDQIVVEQGDMPSLLDEAQPFYVADMRGTVTESQSRDGRSTRTYKVGEPMRAVMVVSQHGDGRWEVATVRIADDYRRQGLGSAIYDAVERDLGTILAPSGWLTEDGYRFWSKRNPEAVEHHVNGGPLFDDMWLSPKQIDTTLAVLNLLAERTNDPIEVASAMEKHARLKEMRREVPDEAWEAHRLDAIFSFTAGYPTRAGITRDALLEAKDMARNGATPEEVTDATGWALDARGSWQYTGRDQDFERSDDDNGPMFATATRSRATVRRVSFRDAEKAILAGRAYVVPPDHVAQQLAVVRGMTNMVPENTLVGVLDRLEPPAEQSVDPMNARVRAVYRLADGRTKALVMPLSTLDGLRAFAVHASALGGRPGLFLNNLLVGENLGPAAAGQVWHESIHVLWRENRIGKVAVDRLLAHAVDLRVMDISLGAVLRAIGDPTWNGGGQASVRSAYEARYRKRPDRDDALNQEAVAHMVELWQHGHFTDEQMAPIADILDDIRTGRLSGNEIATDGGISAPLFMFGRRRDSRIKPLMDIIADLREGLGIYATQGRYGLEIEYIGKDEQGGATFNRIKVRPQGSVLGQYLGGGERFRIATDIESVATAGGERMWVLLDGEPRLKQAMDAHADEMAQFRTDAPYDGEVVDDARQRAGDRRAFAAWFRTWITDPEGARRRAGRFTQAFTDLLDGVRPDLLELIDRVHLAQASEDYQAYVKATTLERARADLKSNADHSWSARMDRFNEAIGQDGTISGWAHKIYQGGIDSAHPLYRAVAKLLAAGDTAGARGADGRALTLAVHEDPYKLWRSIGDGFKTGLRWIQDGMPGYRDRSKRSASIHDAIQLAMGGNGRRWNHGIYQDFGVYLESRRAVEEWGIWEAKQEKLGSLATSIDGLQGARPALVDLIGKLDGRIATREERATRDDALLRDREQRRTAAEADLRDIARRIDELRNPPAEAVPPILRQEQAARRARSLAHWERRQQQAVRRLDAISRETEERGVGASFGTAELDQLRAQRAEAQRRLGGLDIRVRELRAEMKDVGENGLQRDPHRVGKIEHEARIEELEKLHPTFRAAAEKVYEFLWAQAVHDHQAGRLSKAELDYRATRKHFYVPFARDLSDVEMEGVGEATRGSIRRFAKDKKFTGSKRDVIHPLETIVDLTFHRAAATAFNEAMLALKTLAERVGPEGAAIAEVVQKEEVLAGARADLEQLREHMIRLGHDRADAEAMIQRIEHDFTDTQLLLKWTPEGFGPKRPVMIPYWEGGERKLLRINDLEFAQGMQSSINGLGQEMGGFLLSLASAPATLLRVGVTTHPAFVIPNIIRDMFSAFILTGSILDPRTYPLVTQVRGLYHELRQTDYARLYQEVGGLMGGQNVAALGAVRDKSDVMELESHGLQIKPIPALVGIGAGVAVGTGLGLGLAGGLFLGLVGYGLHRGPSRFRDTIAQLSDMSETATRLGVFTQAYRVALANNPALTPYEAAQEAAFVARDLIDFGRRGSAMFAMAKLVPFLNANLQGLDKAARQAIVARSARGNQQSVTKLGAATVAAAGIGFLAAGPIGSAVAGAAAPVVYTQLQARSEAVSDLLRPFWRKESGLPLSADDRRALADSAKAWANLAMYTALLMLVGRGLLGGSEDDPDEYARINAKLKARAQPLKIGGEWYQMPKAFEWAVPSIFLEAAIDAQLKNDPNFWERAADGLRETLVPRPLPQAVALYGDIRGNFNSLTKRAIVPDYMKVLPPQEQFNAYTSQLAVSISRAVNESWAKKPVEGIGSAIFQNKFELSPAIVDYAISSTLGFWGKDAQRASNVARPLGPRTGRVIEYPLIGTIVQRFQLDVDRVSDAHTSWWEQMGRDADGYPRAAKGYEHYLRARDPARANAYLGSLKNDEMRAYALVQMQRGAYNKNLNPLQRADSVLKIIRDLQGDILMERMVDSSSRTDPTPIKLTPNQAAQLRTALGNIAAIEAENALIAIGHEQFAQRKARSVQPALDLMRSIEPRVADQYELRLSRGGVSTGPRPSAVRTYEDVVREWPEARRRLLDDWRASGGDRPAGQRLIRAK